MISLHEFRKGDMGGITHKGELNRCPQETFQKGRWAQLPPRSLGVCRSAPKPQSPWQAGYIGPGVGLWAVGLYRGECSVLISATDGHQHVLDGGQVEIHTALVHGGHLWRRHACTSPFPNLGQHQHPALCPQHAPWKTQPR